MIRSPINIHGRKPTRGLRPWLLIPKVLAVGIYLGSLVTLAAFCHVAAARSETAAPAAAAPAPNVATLATLRWIISHVTDPAGIAATALGILLFLQHPREFARQRWWQVKLGSLVLFIPLAKWLIATHLNELEKARPAQDLVPLREMEYLLWFLAAGVIWIIILGRLKPRLGQNWAVPPRGPSDQGNRPAPGLAPGPASGPASGPAPDLENPT